MIKQFLHSAIWRAEVIFDRLRGQRDNRRRIEPYIGYATPEHLVVRGRVLSALRRSKAVPDQSIWTNFRQMVSLFLTDEVAGVTVCAQGRTATSDAEGYFTLLVPRPQLGGWIDVSVCIEGHEGTTLCPVLVPAADAAFGVISDVDDTVLRTGAYSLWRNLWTSMTGNAATREVFPDAVSFMNALSVRGRNPVYYVSSSPWNLHHFLERIFDRVGLVRGPKFLRDLGVSRSQFITSAHGDHKGHSIDVILAANPSLRFMLIGDTGQHDAVVYRDAVRRHGSRIRAVVLREPQPVSDVETETAMGDIRAMGIRLFHGPDFDGLGEKLGPKEVAVA